MCIDWSTTISAGPFQGNSLNTHSKWIINCSSNTCIQKYLTTTTKIGKEVKHY